MLKKYSKIITLTLLFVVLILSPADGVQAQHATHSVLAFGNWWKLEIREDGIYKISPSDIPALSGTPVGQLALYGQPGGMLDKTNGVPRIDDLQELAIQVYDANSNGLFDNDDYILCFATGPDRWVYDKDIQCYRWQHHAFSNANFLFLTVNNEPHKRIGSRNLQASAGEITSCHAVAVHNRDLTNYYKTGQVWFGEHFSSANSQTSISLSLPAAPIGTLSVHYALASFGSGNSSFTVAINGESRTHNLSAHNPYGSFSEWFPAGSSATVNASFSYLYGSNLSDGYLDYIEIDALVPMTLSGTQSMLRLTALDNDIHPHRVNGTGQGCRIWNVSDAANPTEIATSQNNSTLTFNDSATDTRTYIVFSPGAFRSPVSIAQIDNQDLHGANQPDMVIVCHNNFMEQAQRLAAIHSLHDNLQVLTVSQDQVFNEFSSGQTDPTAIRELLRMFYQRASIDSSLAPPRHLLLIGKGTFDNRDLLNKGLPTLVTYQTVQSFDDDGFSMASDDYFTFLDDSESGALYDTRDVSVGRLPAKNTNEATHLVDKIERYITRSDLLDDNSRGDWRNCVALLADDADPSCNGDTIFTNSSEITARLIQSRYPHYIIDKIYADAYIQQSGADGSFYPDVNNALKKRMDYGCLLLNYIGHGSAQYIGTERYMTKSTISTYNNHDRLAFFITSTCTFGRFDMVDETCGAEEFLLADGAGIGCVAASRPISHIQQVNTEMVLQALNPNNTIGDAMRIAKNNRTATQALTFLGDPALKLSFPIYDATVTTINGRTVDPNRNDSAQVLSTVTIEGEIRDNAGQLVSDFDGTLFPIIYDRAVNSFTLANDNEGCEVFFSQQNNLIYKGRTPVENGRFSFHFVVPRDVVFKYDRARISLYAKSASEDACGAYTNLYLGGFDENVDISCSRPSVRLFINDTNFLDGGITDPNPTLLALLHDSIGINAVGSGIGHDITATIDGNPNNIITLNDFYETDIDDEHSGSIRYKLSNLAPGRHTIVVKAWNIFNYSNSDSVSFFVHADDDDASDFHAFPNPATNQATLLMELNNCHSVTNAELHIYDMRGSCVFSTQPPVSADSYVVGPVRWNLCNGSGARLAPGIYIARFVVTTADGDRLCQQGKIVIK
ncbi:MAG: type IX secretion system sortase PorU [Bacteroidales bacterium]|nr:type IX secretion system sortase PorU [Bacteroidales bacterium]